VTTRDGVRVGGIVAGVDVQERSLASLDHLQVVQGETCEADKARHEEQQGHRTQCRRRTPDVAPPVAGGGTEHQADKIGRDRLDQPASREPARYDDASHAILPVCPAGWSRTNLPSTSVTTRRFRRVTISTLWVATSTAVPAAALSSERSLRSHAASWSRLPVGSSAIRSGGWATTARAIATLCCWPPDSWWGKAQPRSPRPTASRASRERSRASASEIRRSPTWSPKATFSIAFSRGRSL